jgi:hypothetical protein
MVNPLRPDDLASWKKQNQEREAPIIATSKSIVDFYQPNVTSTKIGNVGTILKVESNNRSSGFCYSRIKGKTRL